MRSVTIAVLVPLLCGGCGGGDTSIRLVVDGDLRPGIDVDALDVAVFHERAEAWSSTFALTPFDSLPQSYRVPGVLDGDALVELDVEATSGGRTVVGATREAAFSRGRQVEVRVCLWSFCAGSTEEGCREGRCDLTPADGDGDADADGGSDGGDGDADTDGDTDAETPGSPATFLVSEYSFVTDRLCDVDGDGDTDSAIGDLGSAWARLWTETVNLQNSGAISDGRLRLVAHLPWVDDAETMEDADAVLILAEGRDLDEPPDPADDFSGSEDFHALARSLDPCGEPRYFFRHASLAAGRLAAEGGIALMVRGTQLGPLRGAQADGTFLMGGDSLELTVCGYVTIRELGTEGGEIAGHLLLEWFLAGPTTGVPGFPTTRPDIDLDGDGLEEIVQGSDGHIESCVDGDGTIFSGSDCWRREEVADAFSLTARVTAVRASLAGREPGWRDLVEGTCSDPPLESLWDER